MALEFGKTATPDTTPPAPPQAPAGLPPAPGGSPVQAPSQATPLPEAVPPATAAPAPPAGLPAAATTAPAPPGPPQTAVAAPQAPNPDFMKRGAASIEAQRQEEARAAAASAEYGKAWEFWLKDGEDAVITFVDGDIIPDGPEAGMLNIPTFYSHRVPYSGKYKLVVCTEGIEGQSCPICASGDRRSFTGVLTIVDHRSIPSGDGSKVYQNEKRLYYVPRTVQKILQKLAAKRGGLAGHTFEVSRPDKKSARCGTVFDWVQETTLQGLAHHLSPEHAQPYTYQEELPYYTTARLLEMGLGVHPPTAIGGAAVPAGESLMSKV